MGGFTTGKKEVVDMLRQRSRPYLFSNSMAPGLVAADIRVQISAAHEHEHLDKCIEAFKKVRKEIEG